MTDEERVAETLRTVELSMKDVKGYEVGAVVGRDGSVIKYGIVGGIKSISLQKYTVSYLGQCKTKNWKI